MDKCKLTSKQIQALVNGQEVQIQYSTLEEFGFVAEHEIKLIPPNVNLTVLRPGNGIDCYSPYDAGLGSLSERTNRPTPVG